ncbi:LpxI family protein [Candidatus Omnitrophota bacterium]
MEHINKIAIIAGSGKFPLFLARSAKENNVEVIAVAINQAAEKEIENIADKTFWVNLGEGKKLIDILCAQEIRYAVMAGKVAKTTIIRESLRLDEEARKIIGKVIDRRDDTLLLAVAHRLKDFNIELIDSTAFVRNLMPSAGFLAKRKPSNTEQEDIDFGIKIAKEIGGLDIGQSVAIKSKAIIAVEAIEGTDEMIKRAGKLAGPQTVIIKVSKPNQDMRFDVPVIGLTTIESMKESGSSALAVEADKVLVIEKDEVIKKADEANIAIIAV